MIVDRSHALFSECLHVFNLSLYYIFCASDIESLIYSTMGLFYMLRKTDNLLQFLKKLCLSEINPVDFLSHLY